MCMLDYGEPMAQAEIHHDYIVRRTDARCDECGRPMALGETYTHGQWSEHPRYDDADYLYNPDGPAHLDESYGPPSADDWMVVRQCQHCEAATAWLAHACSGYLYAAVKEDLYEHVGGDEADERTPQLTRLYRWMAAEWKRRDGTLRSVDEVAAQAQLAIEAYDRRHEALRKAAA
jgi:hypothetical protein